jgi:predicted RNA-binding Zn ribbon-like protein
LSAPREVTAAVKGLSRPAPFFIAGSAGLDFLNSIATPVDVPVEWIASGADLVAWLDAAGMLPAEARAIVARASVRQLDAVAARSRALREWFRGFVVAHRGRRLGASALAELAPLNAILARDDRFVEIRGGVTATAPPRLAMRRRWRSPEALLLPIAAAIADVVCNEDFRTIRACDGHACTLFFADHTRSRARRWCSMAICGNRAKQAAHRDRATPKRAGQRARKHGV